MQASTSDSNDTIRITGDIVNFLVNKVRFSNLSYDDKIYVKELKRPLPDLSNTLVSLGKNYNRKFNNSWYQKNDWLTGSSLLNKLFCWPCVLFANKGETVWWKTGYSDMKNLSRALELHTKSALHISANCKLLILGKQNMNIATALDSAHKLEIQNFNNKVRENRDILRSLIDIVIHLCCQEQPFRGHDESDTSSNRGNFMETVSLVSKSDDNLRKFLEKDSDAKSIFSGTSKTIQNELINSVNYILNKKIESEILNSSCFSWQVDETTDISCLSQLSVIFRYINSGKVVERFMVFFYVSAGRTLPCQCRSCSPDRRATGEQPTIIKCYAPLQYRKVVWKFA